MTNKTTQHDAADRMTGRGTVKGQHSKPGGDVTEGGPAPSPTEGGHGHPKGSVSKANAEHAVAGDDTSSATAGKAEKEHAAEAGLNKTQEGRGHRKHDA